MMGIYDSYGSAQLKVGEVDMRDFQVGNNVPIPDGVYVDYGAVVVIKHGRFLGEFNSLTTKWGDTIDSRAVLEPHSAVAAAIKAHESNYWVVGYTLEDREGKRVHLYELVEANSAEAAYSVVFEMLEGWQPDTYIPGHTHKDGGDYEDKLLAIQVYPATAENIFDMLRACSKSEEMPCFRGIDYNPATWLKSDLQESVLGGFPADGFDIKTGKKNG